jgi:hypothetical protein
MASKGRFDRSAGRFSSAPLLGCAAGIVAAIATLLPGELAAQGIPKDATWRYFAGRQEASNPISAWRTLDFDDRSWSVGAMPFRYGDGEGGTVLGGMEGNYTSVFLRRGFTIGTTDRVDKLVLKVDYDDGFVAWLNGEVVARRNAPATLSYDALASGGHESGWTISIELVGARDLLVEGDNVLAVQAFNTNLASSDFVVDVALNIDMGVADTKFSVDRGFFFEPFTVQITTATAGAKIRYTMDSSSPEPTQGELYDGPIEIDRSTVLRAIAYKAGSIPTNVDTHTYIFVEDVLSQPVNPVGFPRNWTSSQYRGNGADYEMDPAVVEHAEYREEMEEALLSLPSLSIVMDPDDMFGTDGVYNEGDGRSGTNSQFEKPASVEIIYPGGQKTYQSDCGIRPHSHIGRKRSLKLLFKAEYGPVKLDFPLFQTATHHADTSVDKFDRIILRAGFNRSWAQDWNVDDTCYTRDQWVRDSQIAMSGHGARGVFVHLYINGLYWGLYNPSERPDAWFTSSYLGGQKEDWFAVNHGGDLAGQDNVYRRIEQFASEGGLNQAWKYAEMTQLLDVEAYSDYLLLNWFAGTGDWPPNNWYGGNRVEPEAGPFQYFAWDAEDCFDPDGSGIDNRTSDGAWIHPAFRRKATGALVGRSVNAKLWRGLKENRDFLMVFADRVYKHCFGDGVLTEDNARARWLALNEGIEQAILGESARWGDAVKSSPRTREHWRREVERVSEKSLDRNVERFIAELRSQGFYPDLDPPLYSTDDVVVPPGFGLTMVRPDDRGEIYYTFDGTDPREYRSGAVADGALPFEDAISIDETTEIKARILDGSKWSALATRIVYIAQDFSALRITEVMYNPPKIGDVDGDFYEFVELKNTGARALDLSGVEFSDGIEFEFPLGAWIEPGELIVVASDATEFALRYPGVPVSGVFSKHLSNAGERVELSSPQGEAIVGVSYDDAAPWPSAADGAGYSLVPRQEDPTGSQAHSFLWRASSAAGGSPGQDDPRPIGPEETGVVFVRGDSNRDGRADISDLINTLLVVLEGVGEQSCPDAMDSNDDGALDLSDPIFSVSFFFIGGRQLPAPYPEEGLDPTSDSLGPCLVR